jgi:hypothetical protein
MQPIIVSSLILFGTANAMPAAPPAAPVELAGRATCSPICSYSGPGNLLSVVSDAAGTDCQAYITSVGGSGFGDFALYDAAARLCTPYKAIYNPIRRKGAPLDRIQSRSQLLPAKPFRVCSKLLQPSR